MPAVTPRRPSLPRTVEPASPDGFKRARIFYALLLVITAIFIIRLFYLQIIRHDYYEAAARNSQLKEYLVPAERGTIYAYDGNVSIPLVLNEKKYTLFADPQYINNPVEEAAAVAAIIKGDASLLAEQLKTPDTRYVILARKLSRQQSDKIRQLELKGIGTREESYRNYPQGSLASQLLGFVNDDGAGQYGVEQALDQKLKGIPGQLRAITDASGVPLVSNQDNVVIDPKPGDKLQLTIDVGLQRQLEDLLKAGLQRAKSESGSAVIMDVRTGAVRAMANYPTFDPAKIGASPDISRLSNAAVSSPLEIGSIMKPLTAAAALDQGVVTTNTTYMDPSRIQIGDSLVTNIEEDGGPGIKSVADILQLSLNTGAVYLLQQMGGGEINSEARAKWHKYMTEHYGLGTPTGIEQSGEAGGSIPHPEEGYGREIQYANTAFGQGMSATILQVAAAYSSIINGGSYFKPHLIDGTINSNGQTIKNKPEAQRKAVSSGASKDITKLLTYVYDKNHVLYGMPVIPRGYKIGGKTGTAQIPNLENGGYYANKFNGTFAGFLGGDSPEYTIAVRVNEPGIAGYAGSQAAAPLFSSIVNMMINNYGVTPKSK